ncbi:MAG: hypothetical protein II672_08375 [Oscillospiraceae bacterium]|nr:hypothetical protein [Oscillospiraceae bacterium]
MSEEVYDICIGSGFSAADAYHISLCTEELAANSIVHGFNDGKKAQSGSEGAHRRR